MTTHTYTPELFAQKAPINQVFPNLQPGDVLELRAGTYAIVQLYGSKKAGTVIIQNAADEVVTVTGISFEKTTNYQIRRNPLGGEMHVNSVGVGGLTDGIVVGPGLDIHGANLADDPTLWTGGGVGIRDATNVKVIGNDIHHGAGIGYEGNVNVLIEGNDIHHIPGDGMSGCFADGMVIRGNDIHDLFPASKVHADGIQGWTARRATPLTGLVIERNRVWRGAGVAVQGLFLGDESQVGNIAPVLRGNMVATSNWWGIGQDKSTDAVIDGNGVFDEIGVLDGTQDMASWLKVSKSVNPTVVNNLIPGGAPWMFECAGGRVEGNAKSDPLPKGDFTKAFAWYEAGTGLKPYPQQTLQRAYLAAIGVGAPPIPSPPAPPSPPPPPPQPEPEPEPAPAPIITRAEVVAMLAAADKAQTDMNLAENALGRAMRANAKQITLLTALRDRLAD